MSVTQFGHPIITGSKLLQNMRRSNQITFDYKNASAADLMYRKNKAITWNGEIYERSNTGLFNSAK